MRKEGGRGSEKGRGERERKRGKGVREEGKTHHSHSLTTHVPL